jgi:hypothetical protein
MTAVVRLVVAVLVLAAGVVPVRAAAEPQRPTTTIAIVGDRGVNPLHEEFRTPDGRDPRYPSGMPRPVRVPLPQAATFADAMAELEAGPLGSPVPGTLYAVAGTRLLIYATPGERGVLGADRRHGTGAASAAAGRDTGTSPDSLVVFVPGTGDAAYGWLAEQSWVDVASTSVYTIPTTGQCAGAEPVRALHRNGGTLLASAGNLYDYYEPLSTPNGLPEVLQVGGTDDSGRTWLPGHLEEEEPLFAAGNTVRPYEVGARYSFPAADGNSVDGTQPFGGTSGATPTVAGYAAELVAEAREVLRSRGSRTGGVLARRGAGARLPARGPLADGDLTRDELVGLLHHAATPAESGPHRYLLEGFGAWDSRSLVLARDVLRGRQPLPDRSADAEQHERVEQLRAVQASRC